MGSSFCRKPWSQLDRFNVTLIYVLSPPPLLSIMIEALQSSVQVGDYVIFSSNGAHNNNSNTMNHQILGEIIHSNTQTVKVQLLHLMDSEILQKFNLRPINPTDYPLAFSDRMLEVYKTSQQIFVERCNIQDLAFVIPIQEVESGLFFLSGAENTFCLRYALEKHEMKPSSPFFYFSRFMSEPFGVRVFTSLNTLSQHVRRTMNHQAESVISKRTFRLPLFSMESFWYLVYKIGSQGIGVSTHRKQTMIKYYNTLKMERCTRLHTLSYLRILSTPALDALRSVLGVGVGLGLAKKRPTKAKTLQYCTIGSILTSIECGPEVPYEVQLTPDCPCAVNGIDFIYYEQNRCLSCTVRFSKVVVREEADATSRIATAEVENIESGVYLNVWFHYENCLLEVVAINADTATCTYVEQPAENIELPLQLVSQLVASFGNS